MKKELRNNLTLNFEQKSHFDETRSFLKNQFLIKIIILKSFLAFIENVKFSRNEIENVLGIANEESTYALEYIIPQWDNKKIRFLFSGSSKNSLIDYMCIHK